MILFYLRGHSLLGLLVVSFGLLLSSLAVADSLQIDQVFDQRAAAGDAYEYKPVVTSDKTVYWNKTFGPDEAVKTLKDGMGIVQKVVIWFFNAYSIP